MQRINSPTANEFVGQILGNTRQAISLGGLYFRRNASAPPIIEASATTEPNTKSHKHSVPSFHMDDC